MDFVEGGALFTGYFLELFVSVPCFVELGGDGVGGLLERALAVLEQILMLFFEQ